MENWKDTADSGGKSTELKQDHGGFAGSYATKYGGQPNEQEICDEQTGMN